MTMPDSLPNGDMTPSPNAEPSGSVPDSGSPPPTPEPWRVPDTHPIEALRGRTAEEVLALTTDLAQAVTRAAPPATTAAPAQTAPQYVPPSNQQWMTDPNTAAEVVAARLFQQTQEAQAKVWDGLQRTQAETIRALANQRFADDFRRWGPEIDGTMAQVPLDQRTLDNYEKVVTYVRGKHALELAREEAQKLMAQGALGERSNGAMSVPGASGNVFSLKNLPDGLATQAERHGLTVQQVVDYCKANNCTPEQWLGYAKEKKLFTSISPFSVQLNAESLGATKVFDG